MQSLRVMGWVSIFIALAILGMGGAPIAEKFDVLWLMTALKWLSYVSVVVLVVAALGIGGLGLYHGILTVLGKDVGTLSRKSAPEPFRDPVVQRQP
jgi:hypothetical protein